MLRQDAKTPRRQKEPSKRVDLLARQVIGAAIEVHRHLGPGFSESVYENALCAELTEREIPFVRQPDIDVIYKGQLVGQGKMDIWVARKLVVELKAVEQILPKHKAQANAYLCATGNELALVINFQEAVLKDGIHRVVRTRQTHNAS